MNHKTIVAILTTLAVLICSVTNAGEKKYRRYRLYYPPAMIVRAADVQAFSALARYPLCDAIIAQNNGTLKDRLSFSFGGSKKKKGNPDKIWKKLPALKNFRSESFFTALRKHNASNLHYILLPPPVMLEHGIFIARIPGLNGKAEQFFMEAGAKKLGKIPYIYHQGVLYLASSKYTLENYLGLKSNGRSPLPEAKWPDSVENFLDQKPGVMRIWLDFDWLSNIAGAQIKFNMQRLAANLRIHGIEIPPALIAELKPTGETVDVTMAIPFNNNVGIKELCKSSERIVLSDAFDSETELKLELRIDEIRKTTGLKGLFPSFFDAYAKIDYVASYNTELGYTLLKLLTGLHAQDDLLGKIKGQAALAILPKENENDDVAHKWVFVADITDTKSFNNNIRLAKSWSHFFAKKYKGGTLISDAEPLPGFTVKKITFNKVETHLALKDGYIYLTNNLKLLPALSKRIDALKPRKTIDSWLTWKADMRAGMRSAIGKPLGKYSMASMLLGEEEGLLAVSKNGFVFRTRGIWSPLTSSLGIAELGMEASGFFTGNPASGAKSMLANLMQAQHTYYSLRLGEFNGLGKSYAPNFTNLATDKAENGQPIEGMYARFFKMFMDINYPGVTFRQLMEAIDKGMPIDYYYRYRPARTIGGRPLDLKREYAIVAVPQEERALPALVIFNNGKIYSKAFLPGERQSLADLPGDMANAGWKEE